MMPCFFLDFCLAKKKWGHSVSNHNLKYISNTEPSHEAYWLSSDQVLSDPKQVFFGAPILLFSFNQFIIGQMLADDDDDDDDIFRFK